MTFSISGRKIGASFKPYIIAEVSANHNGDLAKGSIALRAGKVYQSRCR